MEYNSGSSRASNFKSAERVARGQFEFASTITPELYETKSNYQLTVSATKYSKHREYILSELQTVEKQLLKEPNSVQMIDARVAKLSDYSYPIIKSSNWTAVIGYPRYRATIT